MDIHMSKQESTIVNLLSLNDCLQPFIEKSIEELIQGQLNATSIALSNSELPRQARSYIGLDFCSPGFKLFM